MVDKECWLPLLGRVLLGRYGEPWLFFLDFEASEDLKLVIFFIQVEKGRRRVGRSALISLVSYLGAYEVNNFYPGCSEQLAS